MQSCNRVVVTGMGAITGMGRCPTEIWQSVLSGAVGYGYRDLSESHIHARFFSFIEDEHSVGEALPARLSRALGREGELAFYSALQAMTQAFPDGNWPEHYAREKAGLVMGTGWGGGDAGRWLADKFARKGSSHPLGNLKSMPSSAAGACATHFGLHGTQLTLSGACAAGAMAVGQAYREIQRGGADMMLAGGSESISHLSAIWEMDVLQALTKEPQDIRKACCPFSSDRSGFVLGEGAAVLVLENYDSAKRRGATILGEVVGYGYRCDASGFVSLSEDLSHRAGAISAALNEAGLDAADINYINAHGTSTPANDVHETLAIKRALGEQAYHVPVSSTKSSTGHLIGAAGALESLFCLHVLNGGVAPATWHLDSPDPQCDLNYLANRNLKGDFKTVMNLNSGFGGHNTALIFQRMGA